MATSTTSRWATLSTKQAFCIHLALSVLIFVSLVAVMMTLWFPGKLFFLDGGWQGLKIVALIDLVLGPALTLMLYKPGKPKLLMDMSFVAAFQIAALAYGFYATHSQRTVAMVYSEGAFVSLSADAKNTAEADLQTRNLVTKKLKDLDDARPAVVMAPPPTPESITTYLNELLNGFPEGHERLDRLDSTASYPSYLKNAALQDQDLPKGVTIDAVDAAIKKRKLERNNIQLHRFKTRYAEGVALYDPQSNKILDYISAKESDTLASAE